MLTRNLYRGKLLVQWMFFLKMMKVGCWRKASRQYIGTQLTIITSEYYQSVGSETAIHLFPFYFSFQPQTNNFSRFLFSESFPPRIIPFTIGFHLGINVIHSIFEMSLVVVVQNILLWVFVFDVISLRNIWFYESSSAPI